jgi:hypothetical protein
MSTSPMGVDDLGVLLKHTPDWVRAQCRAGRLPHHKIGKRYVFTPEDVTEILTATAVKARPELPAQPVPRRSGRRLTYTRVGSSANPLSLDEETR